MGPDLDHDRGLVAGYILDGRGGGKSADWQAIEQWRPEQGILWAHFDVYTQDVHDYLFTRSGLDRIVAEALLELETRPRTLLTKQGLLLVLRGVNLNPGANPEDMVAIRIWSDGQRIYSVRRRKLLTIQDMRDNIEAGQGPSNCGEFMVDIADRLVERMANVVSDIDDTVDQLEDQVISSESYQLRTRIAHVRREAIGLRRYLAPQRDALMRLQSERLDWLNDHDRMRLREVIDRTTRYVEDLDAARERAAVSQEELMGRLSEQMDRRMYLLSLVAAIFLPLGFLTGLLGINVGGIPGAEYHWGFAIVSIVMLSLVIVQFFVFKRRKWL